MIVSVKLIREQIIASVDLPKRTQIIKRLIETFRDSERRKAMEKGENYYLGTQDILHDKKRDNKIVVNVDKVVIDQKVGYINLAGVKVEANDRDEAANGTDKEKSKEILDLDKSINSQVNKRERLKYKELHTSSSSKGVEHLHYFINTEGVFATKVIDGKEIVEIRNPEGNIEFIIRFYLVDVWVDDNFKKVTVVELWDDQMSWIFKEKVIRNGDGTETTIYELDGEQALNPCPHIIYVIPPQTLESYISAVNARIVATVPATPIIDLTSFQLDNMTKTVQVHGWGSVPFTPLNNNKEKAGDLAVFKSLQDDLNKNVSDISNNFDEIQEIVTFTKGFEETLTDNAGEPVDPVKAARLLNYMVKQAKAINLPAGKDEDADFGFKTADIPVEKRYAHIEALLSMMYMVAMAVSPKQMMESSVTTGVGITKLFSLLDIKANNNVAYIELFLEDYGAFYTTFYNVVNSTDFTKNNITWIMTKNRLMNTKEMVEIAILLSQIISQESVLKMLPAHIVESVAEELKRLNNPDEKPKEDEGL